MSKKSKQLDIEAEEYVKNLLSKGSLEPIDSRKLTLPEWHDPKQANWGRLWGIYYQGFLFAMMLLGSQALLAIESVLTILQMTKQSNTPKLAYKRYMQTIGHVTSWYRYELKPGTVGWQSIEYVRNAHVKASEMAKKSNMGVITQKDMVLTQFALIGFGLIEADGLSYVDPRFFETTIALWRLIGYLLGIKDEYNICTGSWETCRRRFHLLMQNVLRPALEKPAPHVDKMTRVFTEGMRSELLMSHDLSIAFIKHKSGCKGYKTVNDVLSKLGFFDGIVLRYMIFQKYIYQFIVLRIIINITEIISILFKQVFPVLAIIQFGRTWAYTRIFKFKVVK